MLEVCLICRPLAAQWDESIDGTCGNQIVSFVAVEATGLALDLAILASPLPLIVRLHVRLAFKIQVMALLDVGFM